MTKLRVSPSGQVYVIDLPQMKVTRDEGGGWYLHGQGHFLHFDDLETAMAKKREIDVYGALGGSRG